VTKKILIPNSCVDVWYLILGTVSYVTAPILPPKDPSAVLPFAPLQVSFHNLSFVKLIDRLFELSLDLDKLILLLMFIN